MYFYSNIWNYLQTHFTIINHDERRNNCTGKKRLLQLTSWIEVSSGMSISSVTLEKILEQIKIARNRMQQLWDEKGYTDDEVLVASIEVDRLLNAYDRIRVFPVLRSN